MFALHSLDSTRIQTTFYFIRAVQTKIKHVLFCSKPFGTALVLHVLDFGDDLLVTSVAVSWRFSFRFRFPCFD